MLHLWHLLEEMIELIVSARGAKALQERNGCMPSNAVASCYPTRIWPPHTEHTAVDAIPFALKRAPDVGHEYLGPFVQEHLRAFVDCVILKRCEPRGNRLD